MAKTYVEKGFKLFEADHFFTKDEVYSFDATKIEEAHEACFTWVENALKAGENCVVANTFTRMWELQPYIALSHHYCGCVRVLTARGNYQNIHGCPPEVVRRMKERWEPLDLSLLIAP
jgi:hypothetical protein